MATTINFGGNGSPTVPVNNGRGGNSAGKNSDVWKKVAIGGISAIAFGGAAYAATAYMGSTEPKPDDTGEDIPVEDSVTPADDTPTVSETPNPDFQPSMQMATTVNDDMTFAQAFAAARAEVHAGGLFEWHGQVYGTYYGDEWASLSADQQAAFTAGTSKIAADHQNVPNGQEIAQVEIDNHDDINAPAKPEEPADDNEVADIQVQTIDYDPVSQVNTAYVTVDGTDVYMTDIDNDGVFDVLYVDVNGDGKVDENEVCSITEQNITVQDLGGYTEPSLDGYIDEDFMANNDVDIDSIDL